VNTKAAEMLLKSRTGTPVLGVMARSAAVQDSAGTVKLATSTVADPARTVAWYPANVRVLTGLAAIRPIA
jgi:hypothetical protein